MMSEDSKKYILFQFILPLIRARFDQRIQAALDAYSKIMDGQCRQCNNGILDPDVMKHLKSIAFTPEVVLWHHYFYEKHQPELVHLKFKEWEGMFG